MKRKVSKYLFLISSALFSILSYARSIQGRVIAENNNQEQHEIYVEVLDADSIITDKATLKSNGEFIILQSSDKGEILHLGYKGLDEFYLPIPKGNRNIDFGEIRINAHKSNTLDEFVLTAANRKLEVDKMTVYPDKDIVKSSQ